MISRTKQQQVKKKRKHKNAFQQLIEEMERRDGYVDRAIMNDPHRDRRERRGKK